MRTVLVDLSILATDTRLRGIGRYVHELAVGLAQAEELRILFLEEVDFSGEARLTDDGAAAVERLTAKSRPIMGRWSWSYRLRIGAARAARRAGADLFHLPHSGATPLRMGTRRVVTCHDLIPLHYPERYTDWRDGWGMGRRFLDLRRFGQADHVIAISEATATDLRDLLGVKDSHISVVYNGIDLRRWSPARADDDETRRSAFHLGGPYLMYVGDADWRKNHVGMFEALAAARRRVPNLQLCWAGKLSDDRGSMLSADAQRFGISDAVHFVGFVDDADLQALYRGAVATMFVSHAEGFGLPVLEAMAVGSPVVTSNRSSMLEIAEGAARCVDPNDAASIADAIVSLANDDSLRDELHSLGVERAAKYGLERQARETVAVYRALLG